MQHRRSLSQLGVAATSVLGLEVLVSAGVLVRPTVVRGITVTPTVWVDDHPGDDGIWRACGWAEVLGFLPESMRLVIWSSTTESLERLDVQTEGDYVVDAVDAQVVPLLRRLFPSGDLEVGPLRVSLSNESGIV